MKAKTYNFKSTTVLPDGTVISDEEWFSQRQVFPCEKNTAVFDGYAHASSPTYRATERAKRRFERTEARRKELEEQQAKIQSELARL